MNKKQFLLYVLLALLGIILIIGAIFWYSSYENEASEGVDSAFGLKCGDGECDRIEKLTGVCPQDCKEENELVGEGLDALNFGLMIHLEGWDDEVNNEGMFRIHAAAVRALADKLEEYSAVGTFEAHTEFVLASETWDDPILQELVERGHAIAVHADVGGNLNEDIDLTLMTKQLRDKRRVMEQVTGVDVRHASGVCSHLDWGEAMIDAEYNFVTGIVGYCSMAMDYEDRPDEYKDCTNPSKCHGIYPPEIEDRIVPWRINTAKNWLEDDPDGKLVIIMEAGGIYAMNEEFGTGSGDNELTSEDVEVFLEQLNRAVVAVSDDEVNTMYLSWSIGDVKRVDNPVVDEWLTAVQDYVEKGTVEWHTIPEMYDLFIANE